jgi:hypothetical protein
MAAVNFTLGMRHLAKWLRPSKPKGILWREVSVLAGRQAIPCFAASVSQPDICAVLKRTAWTRASLSVLGLRPLPKRGRPELSARASISLQTWLAARRVGQHSTKANRKDPVCFSPFPYKARNVIERFFNKIKHFRRIATRYDKNEANYLAALLATHLARRCATRPAEASHPVDRRARRNAKMGRRLMPRHPPLLNRQNNTLANIHRIRSSHSCWPPFQPTR